MTIYTIVEMIWDDNDCVPWRTAFKTLEEAKQSVVDMINDFHKELAGDDDDFTYKPISLTWEQNDDIVLCDCEEMGAEYIITKTNL